MASILAFPARGASAAERSPRTRVRLELTRRGRLLLTAAAFLLGILVALAGLLFLGGPWAFAGDSHEGPVVTVESGDTLWSYAQQYAPAGTDPHAYVEDVRRLNGLATPRLTAGQEIVLPESSATGR